MYTKYHKSPEVPENQNVTPKARTEAERLNHDDRGTFAVLC